MNLRRQLAIVRAWFPILVGSVLLGAAAAFLVSAQLPRVFEAKTTLIVGQSLSALNPDYTQLLVSQRLSTTYAEVAATRPILDSVIGKLGLSTTSDALSQRVQADAPLDSTLLIITAQDANPAQAAAIANAIADQLIASSSVIAGRAADVQASIDAELKSTQDQIQATLAQDNALSGLTTRTAAQDAEILTLEGRLVSLRETFATLLTLSSGTSLNLLSVMEPAYASVDPVSPKPLLNTLIGAILGLLIAAALISLAEYLDDRVKDSDAVQEATGLSTLGIISRSKERSGRRNIYQLASLLYPRSGAAEAYRMLRVNIEFASVDATVRTLLVTSSLPGEGKTVTASNLAVVFAQAGYKVLLVDADLRQPGVHLMFDLANTHGLTSLLRDGSLSPGAVSNDTEQTNLRILTTGPLPPNPAELLGSQRMRALLDRLRVDADLLVLDSPPLLAVTDSAVLSSIVDGTVLVVDAARGHRRAVRAARDTLGKAGANVLGVVLNRVPASARSDYADYYGNPRGADLAAGKTPPT